MKALRVAGVGMIVLVAVALGAWNNPASTTTAVQPCNGACAICENDEHYEVNAHHDPEHFYEVAVYCQQQQPGDCTIFQNCNGPFASAIDDFQNVDPKNTRALDRLLDRYIKVAYVATERSAIQVLNCSGNVAFQIPLDSSALEKLTD